MIHLHSFIPKASLFISSILICVPFLFAERMAVLQPNIINDIDNPMVYPESRIDVGIIELNLMAHVYPKTKTQIPFYSQMMDDLAQKAEALAKGTEDPKKRIEAINTVLFHEEGYCYDEEGFDLGVEELSCLWYLLKTKKGNCYSLTNLYLTVAQRLGYPVYPVVVPGHYFLRYIDPMSSEILNIDASSNGDSFPDEYYLECFSLSEKAVQKGGY